MRRIEHTKAFRRDWKRESAGVYGRRLGGLLQGTVTLLANDLPLPAAAHDHQLAGEWKDHRDCHLRPDLLLIYRTVALTTTGKLWAWGRNTEGQLGVGATGSPSPPAPILPDASWRQATAGAYHTVAIAADGALLAWGYNQPGRLGIPYYDVLPLRVP